MNKRENKPKPDDRSDNKEKLQDMIGDTLRNMDEAEERMDSASEHEKKKLVQKMNAAKKQSKVFEMKFKMSWNNNILFMTILP